MPVASVRLRRRSDRLWLLGAFLLVALFLLNAWRVPISEKLLPDPRLNRNLERAEKALAKGELSGARGTGAKELFESVLAIDPDQTQAREGLLAVRNAAVARAGPELRAHRLQDARRDLALAESLSAPQVQLQPLRARLAQLEEASVDVPALLARAAAPGVGDEEALALLDQVLAIDSGNALALEGRSELFSAWLLAAEHELDAGRVDAARARIERVLADDPGNVDLPPLRARLGELDAGRERERARELGRARAFEKSGRGREAEKIYRRLAGGSAEARDALARLEAHRAQAEGAAPRKSSKAELARVPGLLAEARDAMQRGEFLAPPGASAWDKLRIAAAIAPHSAQLQSAQAEFVRLASACFGEAMATARLRHAEACLDAWLAQAPTDATAAAARRQLAERWLAIAAERIGASDWPAARDALEAARRWQPDHPQLRAAEARLRRASGASRN